MNTERHCPRLFLYGSLLTGTPDRRLNKQVRRLLRHAHPAMIQARLYNLGHYPGIIPSTVRTERVYGQVVTLAKPHLLRQLDRYEDYFADEPTRSEFIRILIPAQLLPTRKYSDCWVYIYNGDVSGKQRILSGDYVRYKRSRQRW
jgi:pyruvate carboxylase